MRPDWDSYFMKIAYAVSERSTCDRAFVGSVIVLDKRILTTGFNGSPAGQDHCDEIGHLMVDGHCVRTIHAETNAIIQAALHGNQPGYDHVVRPDVVAVAAEPAGEDIPRAIGLGRSRRWPVRYPSR